METQTSLTFCRWAAREHSRPITVDYQPRLRASNVNRFHEKNDFTLAKARSRQYPAQTSMDADYADDIALLANTPAQAESLLHSLEQAAGGIGLHVNRDKTEFMNLNQRGDISTIKGSSLKLMDKFTYQGCDVSSTDKDINTRLANPSTGIDKLSVIWKSDLSDETKRSFFSKQWSCQYFYMDAPHGRRPSVLRNSLTAIAQEYCKLYWTKSGGSIPQNSNSMATYHPSGKPSKLDEQDIWDSAGEIRTNS